MKAGIEAKIEYKEVIGETRNDYRPIRFTRVKYKASPEPHIDIRVFQRGYDKEGEEEYFPTKNGCQCPEAEFRRIVGLYSLTPEQYIHPLIYKRSMQLLNKGDFESAVIQAFKTIETSIRSRINAAQDELGVRLIRKAFHPEKGPLTDYSIPKAEREAFANYIAGSFSYYKNPPSHRDIEMDYISAFERIIVASILLKRIERIC